MTEQSAAELARNISEAETAGAGRDLAAAGRRPQSPILSPERGGEGDKARAAVRVSAPECGRVGSGLNPTH